MASQVDSHQLLLTMKRGKERDQKKSNDNKLEKRGEKERWADRGFVAWETDGIASASEGERRTCDDGPNTDQNAHAQAVLAVRSGTAVGPNHGPLAWTRPSQTEEQNVSRHIFENSMTRASDLGWFGVSGVCTPRWLRALVELASTEEDLHKGSSGWDCPT
ncbi:hypothetical protein BHM03_00014769 [Ensete ventricosum]|nr:hypothetical protein BHM03_00014769 [Ensete ventricosum]